MLRPKTAASVEMLPYPDVGAAYSLLSVHMSLNIRIEQGYRMKRLFMRSRAGSGQTEATVRTS